MDQSAADLIIVLVIGLVVGFVTGILPTWYFARKNDRTQKTIIDILSEIVANQKEEIRVRMEGGDKASVEFRVADLEQKMDDARRKIVTATLSAQYHLAPEVVEKLGLGDELKIQLARNGKVVEERRSSGKQQ